MHLPYEAISLDNVQMNILKNRIKQIRFGIILLICILAGAEVDIFIPSFPELQKLYNLSPFMVQLTLSVNFIAYCVCSLFAGTMADKYNRRTVMLLSLLIFVFGSILCTFAINFPMLVFGRLLQGIGMAGPANLGYVIVMDDYPAEKQPAIMGSLNGLVTLSMAFAPLVGSYLSLYFGWRANFMALLLISSICLIGGYFTIASKHGDRSISLSPIAYVELMRCKELMVLVLGMTGISVTYWLFVSMSPIIYMESLGVKLEHFGFYQGSVCGAFSIVSILSMRILDKIGQTRCLNIGLLLCVISGLSFLILGVIDIRQPLILTIIMIVFAVAAVFPCNILYPFSLNIMENSAGRVTALINCFRLLLTAIAVEVIGYFYNDSFMPLGLTMFLCLAFACYTLRKGVVRILKSSP